MLVDEDLPSGNPVHGLPDRDTIIECMKWLVEDAQEDDMFVFHCMVFFYYI